MTVAVPQRLAPAEPGIQREVARLPARPLLLTLGSILDPDGGLQVRSRVLAEHLSDLGIPAAIVSTREAVPLQGNPPWARSLQVPRAGAHFLTDLTRLVSQAAPGCDVIILAHAAFLPILAVSGARAPVVWDTNECQTLHYTRLPMSPVNVSKGYAWRLLENWAARRSTLAVAIGDSEAAHWLRSHPKLDGRLVTVDHEAFVRQRDSLSGRRELERLLGRPLSGPVLVFVGTMAAKHNVPAARWIIDTLAPALPDTTSIVICGPGSQHLPTGAEGARVACLGRVDDVDSIIAAADLCLAPLASGAGVKTKVLHYLGHERRVAGTPLAFEGIEDAPGIVAAPLDQLASIVARLIASPEPPETMRARAAAQRSWLEQHHGRDHVARQWREALQRLGRQ